MSHRGTKIRVLKPYCRGEAWYIRTRVGSKTTYHRCLSKDGADQLYRAMTKVSQKPGLKPVGAAIEDYVVHCEPQATDCGYFFGIFLHKK